MTSYRERIHEEGYIILDNVFTKEQLALYRDSIVEYTETHEKLMNSGGITIPDFIRHESLSDVASMKDNEKIHRALQDIFGCDDYRFCAHNDIGINRVVGWHKDKLNGNYSKYETIPIWSEKNGEKHEILKVLTYLEDHSDNDDGLKLVPGSHLHSNIDTTGWIQLHPKMGDVIIFDQRITHRGMIKQVCSTRILVSFGFGKNNIFTDNFEEGTIARQNAQNKGMF